MVLENLAQQILSLVNWGITIIVLMIIWEVIQFGRRANVVPGSANLATWAANLPRRFARRTHKRELNEYIMEEKEEKSLDTLKGEALQVLSNLELTANRKYFTHSEQVFLVNAIKEFGEILNEVKRNFRNLSKRTSRADNHLDKMFDYFKKKGIKVPEEVKALENNIMKLHQQTAQDIAGVEELYRKILGLEAMEKLESITLEMFGGANYSISTNSEPFNLKYLYDLIEGFRKEEFLLEDAYQKQTDAKKKMIGIIGGTRSLYE